MRTSGVYLSVSSFTDLFNYGQFEVNWFGIPEEYFDKAYVALIKRSSLKWNILVKWPVTKTYGRLTTAVDAPMFPLETLMKGRCLGYSAALIEKTVKEGRYKVIISSCFRSRPRWMRGFCSVLSGLTLGAMLIPGTHNSGMYNLGFSFPHEMLYLYNQDQNISHQLAYGIRALDLRVQYYNDQFYITHDTVRGWITIRQVLQDVRWFVNKTGELVLLDFHRFTRGFEQEHEYERHVELQALIVEELKYVLLNYTACNKTIGEIFGNCTKRENRKGHVIVFYNGPIMDYGEYLCTGVKQNWPNAQHPAALMEYLENKACVDERWRMLGIMAELTASFPEFILGNRVGAEWVNHMVTEYFRRNYIRCPAIIYTDFFLGNGIIEVAIEANVVFAWHLGLEHSATFA
ncbi:uncharacterized protein LOC144110902 [Amblyomma americanum]